jgi:hypothetical protein
VKAYLDDLSRTDTHSFIHSTRAPAYEAIFKHLRQSTYSRRYVRCNGCNGSLPHQLDLPITKKCPRRARAFFSVSITRNAFGIVVLTTVLRLSDAWSNEQREGRLPDSNPPDRPEGFLTQLRAANPTVYLSLLPTLWEGLRVAAVILCLGHIAVSMSHCFLAKVNIIF